METIWKTAAITCAALFAAQAALAEMTAPTAEELSAWSSAYAAIGGMEPKWAVQGADAFKASSDAGVPVVYLDVRTEKEWEKGIIEGAVKATLTGLATDDGMGLLPESKTAIIAVYCKSGHRSALAVPLLHRLGYTNAISMKGGYEGWVKAGYPVEGATE
ncbi:MAG: rhodanese-like domain-containing protein [Rhodobacter sp.]|nr:rhodanese-like domain-containing protein [Rhodobacter sp.]